MTCWCQSRGWVLVWNLSWARCWLTDICYSVRTAQDNSLDEGADTRAAVVSALVRAVLQASVVNSSHSIVLVSAAGCLIVSTTPFTAQAPARLTTRSSNSIS